MFLGDTVSFHNKTQNLSLYCGYIYLLTYGAEPFLRSCQLCSPSITPQHFMEPEGFNTVLTRALQWYLS
jgi:hypothetical protein